MPALSEMGFFFGFNVDEQRFDPLEMWSDELLATHWPEDLTNPLVLQRLAAENSANAAHTLAPAIAAPVTPAAHGPITSEPAMPPAGESSVGAAPLTHAPAHPLDAAPELTAAAQVSAVSAAYGINHTFRELGRINTPSDRARADKLSFMAEFDVPSDWRKKGPSMNMFYHLLPDESIFIPRGASQDTTLGNLKALREKASRASTMVGAVIRVYQHDDYIEIYRMF